jgi:hypothetical protein
MANVTVACKLPNGLQLDLVGYPGVIKLNGVNSSNLIGGYGVTEGVDKSFFDAWLVAYKDSALVKNDIVFAYEKSSDLSAAAKAHVDVVTGLEPIVPPVEGAA